MIHKDGITILITIIITYCSSLLPVKMNSIDYAAHSTIYFVLFMNIIKRYDVNNIRKEPDSSVPANTESHNVDVIVVFILSIAARFGFFNNFIGGYDSMKEYQEKQGISMELATEWPIVNSAPSPTPDSLDDSDELFWQQNENDKANNPIDEPWIVPEKNNDSWFWNPQDTR